MSNKLKKNIDDEILGFLKMLLKMKKKRPLFNVIKVIKLTYPNLSKQALTEIKNIIDLNDEKSRSNI